MMKKRKKNEGLSSVSFIITSIGFFFVFVFFICVWLITIGGELILQCQDRRITEQSKRCPLNALHFLQKWSIHIIHSVAAVHINKHIIYAYAWIYACVGFHKWIPVHSRSWWLSVDWPIYFLPAVSQWNQHVIKELDSKLEFQHNYGMIFQPSCCKRDLKRVKTKTVCHSQSPASRWSREQRTQSVFWLYPTYTSKNSHLTDEGPCHRSTNKKSKPAGPEHDIISLIWQRKPFIGRM